MLKKLHLVILFLGLAQISFAQSPQGSKSISQPTFLGKSQPIRDLPVFVNENFGIEELTLVPNNFEGSFDNLVEGQSGLESNMQREKGSFILGSDGVNFDGINQNQTGFLPPDPTGAVGPDHYIQAVNAAFSIFDKSGGLIVGPIALGTFFGSNNTGDPIILYDHLADRWIISQFGDGVQSLLFAVSETSDPTGAYFMYEILEGRFEDYPHYSVWPDGYYLTTNGAGGGGGFNPRDVFVLERDAMLVGDPDAQLITFELIGQFANPTGIFSPAAANITGTEFPEDTPGFFIYLQDDAWTGSITEDHLLVWETDIDWDDINNSTISAPVQVPVNPFDSLFAPFGVGEIDQPGTGQELSGIGAIISYNANYRSFENHNSWLITFNEDVDGNDTSGIRWIELRNTNDDPSWSVFQEGTYAPDDGNSRFMSSGAMDAQGNIGLAFNIGGPTLPAGISYTGRFNGDPLGEMTVKETVIIDGIGVQTVSNRFGDYAHLTMDPDGFGFWHTSEYFQANNSWATRIASFNLSGGFVNDVGIIGFESPIDGDLTNAETVTVLVRNFGLDAQSNFPIALSLDDNPIATEMFTDSIASGATMSFSFSSTLDLDIEGETFLIEAQTLLATDEQIINDNASIEVTHLLGDDVGVTEVIAPVSGTLTDTEVIEIEITNFGSATQTSIPVSFMINENELVEETYNGSIAQGETDTYTFTNTGDFSQSGNFDLAVSTNLSGDQDPSNDQLEVVISSMICMPTADCAGFDDGVTQLQLADQDVSVDCGADPDGYSDDTDIVFNFALNSGNPFEGILQVGFDTTTYAIFIDFNDNNIFESDELISENLVPTDNTDFPFTIDFTEFPNATEGEHIMRVRGIFEPVDGDASDPCGDATFGRTNDYTANITDVLSVEDQALANSELVIRNLGENRFDVSLNTQFDGIVQLSVFNLLGQQLTNKPVARREAGFGLELDLKSLSTGIYLLRLGSPNSQIVRTARLVVE